MYLFEKNNKKITKEIKDLSLKHYYVYKLGFNYINLELIKIFSNKFYLINNFLAENYKIKKNKTNHYNCNLINLFFYFVFLAT